MMIGAVVWMKGLAPADAPLGAILGDGALTSGLSYEGLNNAGHSDRDIIVILNDNEMSIAPNVGAMHKYLVSVQRNPLYNRLRSKIGEIVDGGGERSHGSCSAALLTSLGGDPRPGHNNPLALRKTCLTTDKSAGG